MSNDAITIEFPQEDVRALFRAMDAGMKYMNMHVNHALNSAGRFLVQSIVASTRIAPKKRKVKEVQSAAFKPSRRNLKTFAIDGYFGKPRTRQTKVVYSRDAATAQKRFGKIRNSGLAQTAWKSAAREANLGGGGRNLSSAGGEMLKIANRLASGSRTKEYIKLTSFVGYGDKALRGGERSLETALERASNAMMKSIEKRLVDKQGFGWLAA